MRLATKHAEWLPFLDDEDLVFYRDEMSAREWCQRQLKKHEANLFRLERKARARKAEVEMVKEAAE